MRLTLPKSVDSSTLREDFVEEVIHFCISIGPSALADTGVALLLAVVSSWLSKVLIVNELVSGNDLV